MPPSLDCGLEICSLGCLPNSIVIRGGHSSIGSDFAQNFHWTVGIGFPKISTITHRLVFQPTAMQFFSTGVVQGNQFFSTNQRLTQPTHRSKTQIHILKDQQTHNFKPINQRSSNINQIEPTKNQNSITQKDKKKSTKHIKILGVAQPLGRLGNDLSTPNKRRPPKI